MKVPTPVWIIFGTAITVFVFAAFVIAGEEEYGVDTLKAPIVKKEDKKAHIVSYAERFEIKEEDRIPDEHGWYQNIEVAFELGIQENKPVLALFTGSDWCMPCHMLESNVFQTKSFKRFAENEVILFKADFPKKKSIEPRILKQNEILAERYGVRGYPTILFLDPTGEVKARTGYMRVSPDRFVKHLSGVIDRSIEL